MASPLPPIDLVATYTTDPLNRNTRLVKITWSAPSPATGIVSYNVYCNDAQIGSVLATAPLAFEDPSKSGDVDYFTYYLTSVDATPTESVPSASITNMSPTVEQYINFLRESLKDNPPDPRVRRWTDFDLLLALKMSLSRVNAIPLTTSFTLDSAPPDFFNYILVGARLAALRSQGALEAAKEFNLGAGGTTISINRTMLYNSMVSSEESAFTTEITNIKRYCTMRFVSGEGILTSPLPFRLRTYSPRQYRVR